MSQMQMSDDFEPRIAAWLEADPHRAPAGVLEGVLSAFPAMPQRRRAIPSWSARGRRMFVAAVVAVAAIAVVGSLLAVTRPPSSSVGGPAQPIEPPASSQVGQEWNSNGDIAVTIHREAADTTDHYWRAATYDVIDRNGWRIGPSIQTARTANSSLLEKMADDPDPVGKQTVSFTVVPDTFRGSIVLSPATPIRVDSDVRLQTIGRDGYFARADRAGASSSSSYSVTALVDKPGADSGAYNVGVLRATGTDYPTEITQRYLGVAEGSMGPNARGLEQQIVSAAASNAPVDLVESIMRILRSNEFEYSTDVRGLHCEQLSTVECFATYKQGFCQYYAATMAVILRDLGVPTRIVDGFLPGERTGDTEVIRNNEAHAWVEVYFPGHGWIQFDPTGANNPVQLPVALPS